MELVPQQEEGELSPGPRWFSTSAGSRLPDRVEWVGSEPSKAPGLTAAADHRGDVKDFRPARGRGFQNLHDEGLDVALSQRCGVAVGAPGASRTCQLPSGSTGSSDHRGCQPGSAGLPPLSVFGRGWAAGVPAVGPQKEPIVRNH